MKYFIIFYIECFKIRDQERIREKTIKINIIFIYFYFIPFLSSFWISKLHGYEFSIMRNIIYRNMCRRHNFLYRRFWVLGWRENKRENYKNKYYFHLFLFYSLSLFNLYFKTNWIWNFPLSETSYIPLYIQNPLNIFNTKTN